MCMRVEKVKYAGKGGVPVWKVFESSGKGSPLRGPWQSITLKSVTANKARKSPGYHCFLHKDNAKIYARYLLTSVFTSEYFLPKYRIVRLVIPFRKRYSLGTVMVGRFRSMLPCAASMFLSK